MATPAALVRAGAPRAGVLRAGALALDWGRVQIMLGGVALRLTRSEFLLLAALMARPGEALSRRALAEAIRSDRARGSGRAIDQHLYLLRGKLRRGAAEAGVATPALETVPGFGYRLLA